MDASGSDGKVLKEGFEEYILLGEHKIRLDKVITLFGQPGPAYGLYDSYANACLTCEDLDQF